MRVLRFYKKLSEMDLTGLSLTEKLNILRDEWKACSPEYIKFRKELESGTLSSDTVKNAVRVCGKTWIAYELSQLED